MHILEIGSEIHIHFLKDGLPSCVQRTPALAFAVAEGQRARREAARASFSGKVGGSAIAFRCSNPEMLDFIGEAR